MLRTRRVPRKKDIVGDNAGKGRRMKKITRCFAMRLVSRALVFIAVFGACPFSDSAWAHKVNLFAYVEGDKVFVEGYFSKSRKAMDCPVVVYDAQGKKIHEGKTDEEGKYVFKSAELAPHEGDLKVVLIAGQGHQAEYRLGADERPGGLEPGAGRDESRMRGRAVRSLDGKSTVDVRMQARDFQEFAAAIRDVVKRENQPIIKMLGNQQKLLLKELDKGPTVRDVIGGIGWILGIMGVAAYFKSRNGGRRK